MAITWSKWYITWQVDIYIDSEIINPGSRFNHRLYSKLKSYSYIIHSWRKSNFKSYYTALYSTTYSYLQLVLLVLCIIRWGAYRYSILEWSTTSYIHALLIHRVIPPITLWLTHRIEAKPGLWNGSIIGFWISTANHSVWCHNTTIIEHKSLLPRYKSKP